MDSLRLASEGAIPLWQPCSRCSTVGRAWDRIDGSFLCPACQEAIVQGAADPLKALLRQRYCAVCHAPGVVDLATFPLNSNRALEIDLCPMHFRAFMARRLGAHAHGQLRRQLAELGIEAHEVFLLHEAFYDAQGQALLPAVDPEVID